MTFLHRPPKNHLAIVLTLAQLGSDPHLFIATSRNAVGDLMTVASWVWRVVGEASFDGVGAIIDDEGL